MDETLLTLREVMDRLKLSRATIYNLITRGKLAPVKIGKSTRFKKSDIDTFINQLGQRDFEELAATRVIGTELIRVTASLPEGTLEIAA